MAAPAATPMMIGKLDPEDEVFLLSAVKPLDLMVEEMMLSPSEEIVLMLLLILLNRIAGSSEGVGLAKALTITEPVIML